MTGLGRRILVGILASVLALAVTGVAVTAMRSGVEHGLKTENDLMAVQRLWALAVGKEVEALRGLIGQESRSSGLIDAGAGLRLSDNGVERVSFYDTLGQVVQVWPPTAAQVSMDDRRISQLVAGKSAFHEVRIDDRRGSLVIAGALPQSVGPAVVFVGAAGLEEVLADVVRSAGQSGFIVDAEGNLIAAQGGLPWSAFEAAFRQRRGDVFEIDDGAQTVQAVALPLRSADQGRMGHAVILRDVTLTARWLDVLDIVSIAVIVVVCAAVIAVLRWFLGRTLGPLGGAIGAMALLSRGDTSIEVLGTRRQDEIGEMARSIAVFRDRARLLRESQEQRRRQWSRQQEFIRAQMLAMAETLPPEGREAFLDDLARIEERAEGAAEGGDRALAHALEVMTERVSAQHRRLDDLVKELRAALDTRTELFQLQQQVEVARGMQRSMLPRGILPRPELEVSGRLVPAAEFDGAFYDYTWIGEDIFAVTLGQPATPGLGGGYQSATVRASLRALLGAGLSPAACLERTARLLSGEEDGEGYAMACGIFEPTRGTMTWAATGIADPFLVRRLGDAVHLTPAAGTATAAAEPGEGAEHGAAPGAHAIAEVRFEVPRRAAVVLLSPGVVLPGAGPGRERVVTVLRTADDISPGGLIDVLRREGITDGASGGNVRDRLCVVVRFQA